MVVLLVTETFVLLFFTVLRNFDKSLRISGHCCFL